MIERDPENIDELRKGLCGIFKNIVNATLEPKRAKEANNAAGKIIGTIRAELESADLRKEEPNIPFLNYQKKKAA